MKILNGKKIAEEILEQLAEEIKTLGFTPGLSTILVGEDPASQLYISIKEKACQKVGIRFKKYKFDTHANQEKIIQKINDLNNDDEIDGILIQLPLPKSFNTMTIISKIDPIKDADGFHPKNLALLRKSSPRIIPGITLGIMRLIEESGINLAGKNVVVVSNSRIFAEPILILAKQKERAAIAHFVQPNDEKLLNYTRRADVLVVSVGRPQWITDEAVKFKAVVIDVGTNRVNGKVIGDVHFESVSSKAAAISPVPGGIGPMTVAMLLKNVVHLAKLRRHAKTQNV